MMYNKKLSIKCIFMLIDKKSQFFTFYFAKKLLKQLKSLKLNTIHEQKAFNFDPYPHSGHTF